MKLACFLGMLICFYSIKIRCVFNLFLFNKNSIMLIFDFINCVQFFRCLPDKTHAFKDEKCAGGKLSKERLTVLVTASMVGEKFPLLVIGKHANPRCFKGLKKPPLQYASNKKAWMTSTIFEDYVKKLDRQMGRQNRKIALVLDNCMAHPHVDNLRNVMLIFLPPNTMYCKNAADGCWCHSLLKGLLSQRACKTPSFCI